jgi:hypothetical protein
MRLVAALLLLAACGNALPIGVGPDLAPSVANDIAIGGGAVGAPCAGGGDCASGTCFTQPPFTGGYCSQHIGECPAPGGIGNGPCPAGTICINPGVPATGGADYCLSACTHDSDCRVPDGYHCCPWRRGANTFGVCSTVCPL